LSSAEQANVLGGGLREAAGPDCIAYKQRAGPNLSYATAFSTRPPIRAPASMKQVALAVVLALMLHRSGSATAGLFLTPAIDQPRPGRLQLLLMLGSLPVCLLRCNRGAALIRRFGWCRPWPAAAQGSRPSLR